MSGIKYLSTAFDNNNVKRIGKYSVNSIRIIKITMDCRNDVTKVLTNWRLIPKKFIVSADLTMNQRECLNSLKEQAREFNVQNDLNPTDHKKIVKFIRGNLTLITK